MNAADVQVLATGTANTASVLAALERQGARGSLTGEAVVIRHCRRLVVPGVGTFGAAARRLDELGLREPLRQRIEEGRPTLAICLGLQLLCAASEESPGARGLGIIEATVRRFPAGPPVPQLGWNRVAPSGPDGLLEAGWAYFAHAFRLEAVPPGWEGASSDYNGPYASALARGAVLACQFHPELSGRYGAELLGRWLELGGAA